MVNNKISLAFGKSLSEIRRSQNLTQERFASILNGKLLNFGMVTNYEGKSISNWENGTSIPQLDVLIAISQIYNVSLDEMFGDKIQEMVEKSAYSYAENAILDDYKQLKSVCTKKDNRYISSWNEKMCKYGQLSYLADNLIGYCGSLSKNFEVLSPRKEVEVLVGIVDYCDGKWQAHYIGNGPNDIKSVQNIPAGVSIFMSKNGNLIDAMMQREVVNDYCYEKIVKLNNGKQYVLKGEVETNKKLPFEENNIPEDLQEYDLNTKDFDFLDYATLKGHYVFDEKLFEMSTSGCVYYKEANVFEINLTGKFPHSFTDEQLVKVLTDDYKHRLIRILSKISDERKYYQYVMEIENYENMQDDW